MKVTLELSVFCRHCDNEKMIESLVEHEAILNSQTFECPKCHHRIIVEQ